MTKAQKYPLLVLLMNFEKYWISYYISNGSLFSSDVKREAKALVDYYSSLTGNASFDVTTTKGKRIERREDTMLRQLVESLSNWLNSGDLFPSQVDKSYVSSSKNYVLSVLSEIEKYLCQSLSLQISLSSLEDDVDGHIHERILRWSGQFPDTVVPKVNDQFIARMSGSDSLILVADIRHSQDLMTYGSKPEVYRDKIIDFIDKVRAILKKHYAVYDRFTGDGFIAYFNEYLCGQEGKDYYQMMIESCREIIAVSKVFFPVWKKCLRRIPDEEIGLCIGVDSGSVSYKDIKNQLFAIGDACVWATRMSSAGKAGDIILNNLPYQHLFEKSAGVDDFKSQLVSESKNGEKFMAFRLDFDSLNLESFYSAQEREKSAVNDKPDIID